MSPILCPDPDEALLPLVLGDEPPAEVHGHLSSCPTCRERLAELKTEVSTLRQAAQDLRATVIFPGDGSVAEEKLTVIGRYMVTGILGEGSQAVVYRAYHPNLNRELAIKLSKEQVQDDEPERDLLVREGKLLANVQHPNLVGVLDLDFHQNRPFVAYEFIHGRNLEQVAQEVKLRPAQAAGLVAQIARALELVHQRGIVHQDIKPRNIMVDDAGRPRLLDFGLARFRSAWSADAPQPAGGTVSFMAPEQARTEYETVSARSDIFSLGGVLYFLLTGKDPFSASSWQEAQDRAGRCDFDRAALRAARVPSRLQAICLRAMDAEPSRRYASASDLAADLERFIRRPRVLAQWTVAAAAVILIGFGGAFAARMWSETPLGRDQGGQTGATVSGVPQAPAKPQVLVKTVQRKKNGDMQMFDKLDETVLPMRVGDLITVGCDVPVGLRPALFWFDTEGRLTQLEASLLNGELRHPKNNGSVPLHGRPGTELILVCADKTEPPSLEEMTGMLNRSRPLPVLPANVVLFMDRDKISLAVNGKLGQVADFTPGRQHVGPPEKDALSRAQEDLNDLRLQLRERCSFVAGFAFHLQGPSTQSANLLPAIFAQMKKYTSAKGKGWHRH